MLLADVALHTTEAAAVRACSLLTLGCVVQARRSTYYGSTCYGSTNYGSTYCGHTYYGHTYYGLPLVQNSTES